MTESIRSPSVAGFELTNDHGRKSSSPESLASGGRVDDTSLSSFIDALWDEQMANSSIDFVTPEQQQAYGSLGHFGDLHILDGSATPGQHLARTLPFAASNQPGQLSSDLDDALMHGVQDQQAYNIGPSHESQILWQPQHFFGCDGVENAQSSQNEYRPYESSTYLPFGGAATCEDSTASQTPSQVDTNEDLDVAEIAEPCYARLLHKCLRETPSHTLTLKEIYAWISQHTQKARDSGNKGWQNSVRHNLSMNAAFERVTIVTGNGETKKSSLWRLTPQAMRDGVISTTRYRRDPKRKLARRGTPAPKRQMSGAKGGAATRAASQARRQLEAQDRLARAAHSRAQQRFFTSVPVPRLPAAPLTSYSHIPSCQSMPTSPYFVGNVGASPVAMRSTFSNPHTPIPVQLSYEEQQKPFLGEYQLQHIDPNQGLFGNVDNVRDYTPSLQTESSYFTDEPLSAQTSNTMMSF